MRPAGAAVLWDVLVACGGEVIGAVDVAPVKVGRQGVLAHVGVGKGAPAGPERDMGK
jgi:hypothetical protein